MEEEYFCSQEKSKNLQKYFPSKKAKIRKSLSQEKAKIRKKYSLRKGRVLQKYFKYSSIMKKESNCLSSLQGMEKRDFQVQNIYIEQKLHDKV